MKFFLPLVSCLVLSGALPVNAAALTLDEARCKKVVSELASGYRQENTAEGKELEEQINAKRKEAYAKIAAETGTAIELVAQQAADKIAKKLAAENPCK